MSNLPKYRDIIADAIIDLNEKGGSSSVAILKKSKAKYGNDIQEKRLKTQLKKMVKDGHLVQVKNSFKLAESAQINPRKSFVKRGGLATKPKKLLSGKKITGAADIMKKLQEDKESKVEQIPPESTPSKKTPRGGRPKSATNGKTSAKRSVSKQKT